jgi:hypothetical protein
MAITLLQPFNLDPTGNYTFGNVTASYFIGNGSQLTGLASGYSNTDAAAYLASGTVSSNIITSGNVSGSYFIGSGSQLGNITGGNVTGYVPLATSANTATTATSATTAGTVTTAAQPNITSVGTLSGLAITGDATQTGNLEITGNLSVTGTFNVTNGSVIVGNLLPSANVTYSLGSPTQRWKDIYLASNTIYLGNVALSTTANDLTVTGNVNANNIVSNNRVIANTLVSNIANGTAPLTVTSITRVANLNVSYANVSDYEVVTTQTTGTFYPTFVNSNTTGNYALASNSAISFNAATGTLSSTKFNGDGSQLGSLTGANVTGYVPLATSANTASSATTAGTVTTAAQPNITSVGTLTGLTVSSTISGSVSGTAATVTTAAQPNITSVGTLTGLTSTGIINFLGTSNVSLGSNANVKITGGSSGQYLQTDGSGSLTWATVSASGSSSNITNGTSNVNIATSGGNITASVGGTANIVTITTTGLVLSGNLTANSLTLGTGTGGNLTDVNYVVANYFSGNGNLLAYITGSNVIGYVPLATASNTATSATTAGTVTTAAQPNITSVGTLSGLTSTGVIDFLSTSNVSLGSVTNLHITGGTNGYVLSTDGSGTLSWIAQSGGGGGGGSNIVNGTSNVNIATSGGNITASVGGTADVVTITTTGLVTSGNISASYFLGNGSALSSITGANVIGEVTYANVTDYSNVTAQTTGTFYPVFVNGNTTANYSLGSNSALAFNAATGVLSVGTVGAGVISGVNTVTANNFIGNLTGTVSGSVSGTAATVTTAAQPNITSTGTLTSLTVSGLLTATSTGIKVTTIQDSTGTTAITTGYGSVAGAAGVYSDLTVGTSGTGSVTVNGNVTAVDINNTSDERLKENAQPITNPLAILSQLFGMSFNWIADGRKSYGLMAQEVEKVLPELVLTDENGKKSVNYIPLIAFLIEAVKNQQQEIDNLKKR